MAGRFAVNSGGGVDNPGLQLNEMGGHNDTLGEMYNAATPASLAAVEPGRRRRSLAQFTREALPRLDNYRNSKRALKRPSLGELHGEETSAEPNGLPSAEVTNLEEKATGHGGHGAWKLGWIQGVLIPCLLNIWGVMLFLRLSWVVAQSGIVSSLIIIGISALVCVITTMSLSAISSNGDVKGGGIYYLISRSLGPEFGAAIGLVFAFANAVAASMNTIGFCDSLNGLLKSHGTYIIDGAANDVRLVGVIAIFIMVIICAVGMEWESKAQNFLIVVIAGAIVDFMAGAAYGPTSDEVRAQGFTGLSWEVFKNNTWPDYRFSEGQTQNFFSVFSIFFPSVTGIQAGANISGDLKDPATAIPKGTLLSVVISMTSYAAFALFAGGAAQREATGSVADLHNGTLTSNCLRANVTCSYGLQNDYSVMQVMSLWGFWVYAGCWAATLSTALTNLLSVPRLIQALGIDRIYPGLIFFSKGYGKNGEPYRGYVLVFIISAAFVLIANINAIAPLISNFYLASYALINFCTFHASFVKPVGWRPKFQYYNTWVSLFGFIICVAIMFLINWVTSLVTFVVTFALYLVVVYRKPDVNWGSSTQAQHYKAALTATQKLTSTTEHVKNYFPQILVLCGRPSSRPPLIDFANLITKNNSLLLLGEVSEKRLSYRTRINHIRDAYDLLKNQMKVKAFFSVVDDVNFELGTKALIQASGVGRLAPNVVMLGYKTDWRICSPESLTSYFNVLHNAFDNRLSVAILRCPDGLDFSRLTEEEDSGGQSSNELTLDQQSSHRNLHHCDSNASISHLDVAENSHSYTLPNSATSSITKDSLNIKNLKYKKKNSIEKILYTSASGQQLPKATLESMTIFRRKQPKGTIDVWWLYDDGGLTMLLPYIINTRSNWSHCKLRIFALSNDKNQLEVEERNMANMLGKFRLDYSSLQMVQLSEKPKPQTVLFFDQLILGFKQTPGSDEQCKISAEELNSLKEKTNRQLRLRELLLENSSKANLIVMSLPMPRRGTVSAPLYMAWLEVLTKDLPPYLLVRGNQQSVLTFSA